MNLGSLMSRWTNGLWQSTLHRVSNPRQGLGDVRCGGRRLSVAYFHKVDYDCLVEVLPTCYDASSNRGSAGSDQGQTCGERDAEAGPSMSRGAESDASGSDAGMEARAEGAARPTTGPGVCGAPGSSLGPLRFGPALASDLTRAGMLHRWRHLPPEEASRRYHEQLAAQRSMGTV